jgi:hypothetical protein
MQSLQAFLLCLKRTQFIDERDMAMTISKQRRFRANASKRRSTLNGLRLEQLEDRRLLATYADVVLADSPLAFYEFNEGTGTNTLDSTGNANTGNFVGAPTYVTGRTGLAGDTALDFTPGNRVDITTAATAFDWISTTTDQVTVEMWGFGDPAAQPRTNTSFNLGNGAGNRVAFAHMPWNDNRIYWDAGIGAGGGSRLSTLVSTTQTEGRWNHYVFVKDGTTNFSGMYINGELVASLNSSTDAFANPSFLRIAENHDGMLDDISVYDQALSAAQVTAHYEAGFVNANDDDYTGSNPITEDQTLVISDGANDLVANDSNEFRHFDLN